MYKQEYFNTYTNTFIHKLLTGYQVSIITKAVIRVQWPRASKKSGWEKLSAHCPVYQASAKKVMHMKKYIFIFAL